MSTNDVATSSRSLISGELRSIEQEHGVRVIFACESGSRAWGFESTDSDWDVRYIYHYPPEAYLSIDPPAEQLDRTIDSAIGPLDIVGWDLRKTLRLMRKSNPSLMEWMHSPIQYVQLEPFASQLRSLLVRAFSPIRSAHHYASMAHSNDAAVLQSESVVRKKYFYMLRTTLAYQWALERQTIPPVLFADLLRTLVPSDSPVFREVVELLERKRAGVELGSGPRLPHLHAYLSDAYQRMKMEEPIDNPSANPPSDDELNAFLRATVMLS